MTSRGIIFYLITRDSSVAAGTRNRFDYEGAHTTVEALLTCVTSRHQVDTSRMLVEVRPDSSAANANAAATAAPPVALKPSSTLSNYASVEITITKKTSEHEAQLAADQLHVMEKSLFAMAPSANTAAKSQAPKGSRPALSVGQLANIELLDLPLRPDAAALAAAEKQGACVLCDEKRRGAKPAADGAPHRCEQVCCAACYAHCAAITNPRCPVCGLEHAAPEAAAADPPAKQHRTES